MYHIVLYHIISYHTIYHIIYHIYIVSHRFVSYHIIDHISYHVSSYIISYHIIPYHTLSYYIIYHILWIKFHRRCCLCLMGIFVWRCTKRDGAMETFAGAINVSMKHAV